MSVRQRVPRGVSGRLWNRILPFPSHARASPMVGRQGSRYGAL